MVVLLLLAFALTLAGQDRATDHNFHGWYNYFGDHPFGSSKWGVHLEGQYRRHNAITQGQQLLLRPALNYQLNRAVLLTGGYAYARTHTYSDLSPRAPAINEHRIWEQALLRYRTGNVAWMTRLRFENRFIGSATSSGFRYENRFRWLQQFTVPISQQYYYTAYNELWFYVKPYVSSSAFDQNRLYGALGMNLRPSWRFEIGYMNQALLQRSGRVLESNHTLMFSIFSNAAFRRR